MWEFPPQGLNSRLKSWGSSTHPQMLMKGTSPSWLWVCVCGWGLLLLLYLANILDLGLIKEIISPSLATFFLSPSLATFCTAVAAQLATDPPKVGSRDLIVEAIFLPEKLFSLFVNSSFLTYCIFIGVTDQGLCMLCMLGMSFIGMSFIDTDSTVWRCRCGKHWWLYVVWFPLVSVGRGPSHCDKGLQASFCVYENLTLLKIFLKTYEIGRYFLKIFRVLHIGNFFIFFKYWYWYRFDFSWERWEWRLCKILGHLCKIFCKQHEFRIIFAQPSHKMCNSWVNYYIFFV